MAKQVTELQTKNVDLEHRRYRQNLVFIGVDDNDCSVTRDQSDSLVTDICETKLGSKLKFVQRVHCVGRYKNDTNRVIIVNFASYKERQNIMTNAKLFKWSPFAIDQDYSPETQEIRKRLWEHAKTKGTKKQVELNFNKLVINNRVFTWDKERDEVVPVPSQ